jgi:hypothetical protein
MKDKPREEAMDAAIQRRAARIAKTAKALIGEQVSISGYPNSVLIQTEGGINAVSAYSMFRANEDRQPRSIEDCSLEVVGVGSVVVGTKSSVDAISANMDPTIGYTFLLDQIIDIRAFTRSTK